jgi:hypothetical protein
MNDRDDDPRVRIGRVRCRGSRPKSFINEVLAAANKEGYVGPKSGRRAGSRIGRSKFGRGRGVALISARLLDPTRHVVVKAPIVRHRGRAFRSAPLSAHVAYLKREGVRKDGEPAHMFNAQTDAVEGAVEEGGFSERCREDRHHFWFIVSPEDASEMTDLKAFARDLVADMERDLGTKLDWMGVDHWNADNPHVHILFRVRLTTVVIS